MRQREVRQAVLIRARMNIGGRWSDACIVNLSSRGVGCQCPDPPIRGSYLELRRGKHVIIGRVAWSSRHRFGVTTQDKLAVEALITDQAPMPAVAFVPGAGRDRRGPARPAQRADTNRWRGRLIEYASMVGIALIVATFAFHIVQSTLGAPAAAVALALEAGD